jgi:hypothetical protein
MAEFLETTFDKFIFKVKTGYLYTDDDYWVDIRSTVATVGVTDYLQKSNGDVAFVEPAIVGKSVKKGEELGEIETIKVTLNLISPVTGRVSEVIRSSSTTTHMERGGSAGSSLPIPREQKTGSSRRKHTWS